MPVERRGRAIRVVINPVNWQQEEPNGYGGGRQLSMNGTSRVSGETQARFREGLGVKFPGPTRRGELNPLPTLPAQFRAAVRLYEKLKIPRRPRRGYSFERKINGGPLLT